MTEMPKVKPVLRLIPNGIVDGHLRMTLIATPVASEDGFAFDQWPHMVRDKIVLPGTDHLSIFVGDEPAIKDDLPASILQPRYSEAFQKKIDDAWKGIVPADHVDLWTKLLDTIHRSLASQSFKDGLTASAADVVDLEKDGSYPSQKALDPGQQLTVKAVLPVKHGDLALFLEFERAKRVNDILAGKVKQQKKASYGTFSTSNDDASLIKKNAEEKEDTEVIDGDECDKGIADKKRLELIDAINALRDERVKSAGHACDKLNRPDLNDLAAASQARNTALASHTAATWQQKPSGQTDSDLDRVTQYYQAVVSSPAWARFFGFAFDLELQVADVTPRWISAGDYPVKFKFEGIDQLVGRAWTAVDDDGWPRPDEARGGLKSGLYQMGVDCAGGNAMPRYDVVTLDVRHATEAAVRPLAGPDGQERGFQTAGMTLIDRRRAEDTRAQLRRTAAVKDEDNIQLFAQDVVVGRRLDVGTRVDDKILWRPLGSRMVTYGLRRDDASGQDDFDAIDGSVADSVLLKGPDAGVRTLEEAIVNPSSRLTPTPGGGATDKDVFVDEAFATWNGAPMGVNTAPKVGPDGITLLSFLQKQWIPIAGAKAEALAPPLRYGRSYRFGMRAVFLGGHSKSIDVASKLYETPTQEFTYPRDPSKERQIPMRRFLRQQAIGAPVVLLPGSDLGAKINEMDFGTVHSAVLRSLPDGYMAPDLPKTVKGRPYVWAKDRVTPDEIIRIFVPPQAALDELLRAGVFDKKSTRSDVALGGLRTIAFGVPEPLIKTKISHPPQGSFPIAVIGEQRAFGQVPTRRKLTPGFSAAPENTGPAVRGAAIFIGRTAFENSGGPRLMPRPYYPDPHATQLILRLCRRSDGTYVGPASKVPVYDEKAVYPHAMPTVVVIRKATMDENQPTVGAPITIRTDGVSFTGKNGQRAQRVEITLAKGDDYDLHAFYLAGDQETLATHFALTEMIGAYQLALEEAGGSGGQSITDHITTGFFNVPSDDKLLERARDLVNFACGEEQYQGRGGPIEELAGFCSMRIGHAVNQPLAAPTFRNQKANYHIYRKGFDTSKYVHKYAIDPDFDGTRPPANQSVDAEPRHKPSGLDRTEVTLAELEALRVDLQDTTATHNYILSGQIVFDRKTTAAIEIIASCVAPREVLIDDPSRRRPPKARVSGAWPQRTIIRNENGEPIPPERRPAKDLDVYGFAEINTRNGAVTLHRSEVTLLRIDNIAAPGSGPLTSEVGASEDILDLSLAHIAAQLGRRVTNSAGDMLFSASQLHGFPDNKARLLGLRLRAVSRFGPDFETAARWTGADGNTEPVVRLRQPLASVEQSIDSAPSDAPFEPQIDTNARTITVWLPSSTRPAKCAPLSPVPVFRFIPGTEGRALTVKRMSGVRIYLERGWFSSGEGERLGIVLLASDALAGDEFLPDDRFGPLGPYLTRWGGDSTRKDYAPLVTNLTADTFFSPDKESFGHDPVLVSHVAIPVQVPRPPGAPDNVTILQTADLLTYEPRFDVDREQWFVDVDLAAPETPNLFVRLGLVRYQENAIHEDLRASEPVVVWSQLLPQRILSVEAAEIKGKSSAPKEVVSCRLTDLNETLSEIKIRIAARVSGPSHESVRLPQNPTKKQMSKDDLTRLHQSKVRFRLVHESGDFTSLRRITMGEGEAPLSREKESHAESSRVFEVHRDHVDALGPGVIYVYAEEIETFMPASYRQEPAHIDDIFDAKTFVESGPRFAARLELTGLIETDAILK